MTYDLKKERYRKKQKHPLKDEGHGKTEIELMQLLDKEYKDFELPQESWKRQ
jgi:hypothetical protein